MVFFLANYCLDDDITKLRKNTCLLSTSILPFFQNYFN